MRTNLNDMTSDIMAEARIGKNRSQQYMARALGRSLTTIQNWESGISIPKLSDMGAWFGALGVNPMRSCLNYLHPDLYKNLTQASSQKEIDDALLFYIQNIASDHEKRELAFCIFGETGSSWPAQLDELTARNHLPIAHRINIARITVETYCMIRELGKLRGLDHVMPDIENVERAIENCKESVRNGRTEYLNA